LGEGDATKKERFDRRGSITKTSEADELGFGGAEGDVPVGGPTVDEGEITTHLVVTMLAPCPTPESDVVRVESDLTLSTIGVGGDVVDEDEEEKR
jgi:hypothetical protein